MNIREIVPVMKYRKNNHTCTSTLLIIILHNDGRQKVIVWKSDSWWNGHEWCVNLDYFTLNKWRIFFHFPPSLFLSRGCNTTIRVKQKTHMNFRHYRSKNVQGNWNLRGKWAACKMMSTSTQSAVIQELHMQWCHAYMYLKVEKITHRTHKYNLYLHKYYYKYISNLGNVL